MHSTLGWVMIVFGGLLYVAQAISSIDFSLAQRLGLQEKAESAAPLLLRSERYTAYWDLVTLPWFPIAGVLIVLESPWWPLVSIIAAAIYFDSAGREAVKNLSFRHHGLRMGAAFEQILFTACYVVMFVLACVVIWYSLDRIHLIIPLLYPTN